MVRSPSYIIDIGHIRAQDLPIKTSILNSNFSSSLGSEMFCNSAASCELNDFEVGMVDHILHITVGAVEEVDVVEIQAASLGE